MDTQTQPADASYIQTGGGGTTFVGIDATRLFAAVSLRSAIRMHGRSGMIPTRGATITRMFAAATKITGKPYKRGQHDAATADLQTWIDAMRAALPVVES